jgi:hypothetical protein
MLFVETRYRTSTTVVRRTQVPSYYPGSISVLVVSNCTCFYVQVKYNNLLKNKKLFVLCVIPTSYCTRYIKKKTHIHAQLKTTGYTYTRTS